MLIRRHFVPSAGVPGNYPPVLTSLTPPEYAKQAKEDLARLAAIDDAKATVEQGTEEAPNPVDGPGLKTEMSC